MLFSYGAGYVVGVLAPIGLLGRLVFSAMNYGQNKVGLETQIASVVFSIGVSIFTVNFPGGNYYKISGSYSFANHIGERAAMFVMGAGDESEDYGDL